MFSDFGEGIGGQSGLLGIRECGMTLIGRLPLNWETMWQGGWMLTATLITGVLNYLSNVLMGRMLGPADYGVFCALLSLSFVLGVVGEAIQTVITNYVARMGGASSLAEVGALLVYSFKRLLPWGMAGALMFFLVSRPLAGFLQIPSRVPVIIIGGFLLPVVILPVVLGTLRGLQYFGALGVTQISVAVSRLGVAVGLVSLGLGVTGAVASLPLSNLGAYVLGIFFLRDLLRKRDRKSQPELRGLFEYSLHAVLAMTCMAVLTYGDMILVKSRFPPTQAGLYSAISTLGKTTLWLSGAVMLLLLPKATEKHERGQATTGLVRASMISVGLLCGGVTGFFFLFPSPIVQVFFGAQYLATSSLLGPYGLAMTLFSLVSVWLYYYLAVSEKRFIYVLALGVMLFLFSLIAFGSNLTEVILIMIGTGSVLYLGGEVLLFRRQVERRNSNN